MIRYKLLDIVDKLFPPTQEEIDENNRIEDILDKHSLLEVAYEKALKEIENLKRPRQLTQKEQDIRKLKDDLYADYIDIIEVTKSLSKTEKYNIAKLVRFPEWETFKYMLSRYKSITFEKGSIHGKDKDDLLVMRAKCTVISMLRTFANKFDKVQIPETLTESDPSNTINLDEQ